MLSDEALRDVGNLSDDDVFEHFCAIDAINRFDIRCEAERIEELWGLGKTEEGSPAHGLLSGMLYRADEETLKAVLRLLGLGVSEFQAMSFGELVDQYRSKSPPAPLGLDEISRLIGPGPRQDVIR